jgi:shikimate dehydrogenase
VSINGQTVVAGVVGAPVTHSLSPLIHNAWLGAAGLDGVYVPFTPPAASFEAFALGLRGGAVRGLNITVPFKETALALADCASERAIAAGAANVLLFGLDGSIAADNTDGEGVFYALARQAPAWTVSAGPVVILGAGGAARGAASALAIAGVAELRIVNRTRARAEALAASVGPAARAIDLDLAAFEGAALIVNATTLGLGGAAGPSVAFDGAAAGAVTLDMVYRPLRTGFLQRAAEAGLTCVDGLAMLIGQAAPSFEAFFGAPPPDIDVRALCLAALGETA